MNTNLIEWNVQLIAEYCSQFTPKKELAADMEEYIQSMIENESSTEQINEMHIEYKDSISNDSNFVFND